MTRELTTAQRRQVIEEAAKEHQDAARDCYRKQDFDCAATHAATASKLLRMGWK